MSNIKLTKESKDYYEYGTIYRIKAKKDFINQGELIKKGTLGGWVSELKNVIENGWIADDAKATGKSQVRGNARLISVAHITDLVFVQGDSLIHGAALIKGKCTLDFDSRAYGVASGNPFIIKNNN